VLCCAVLCCAVLCCAVLCCAVLCCAVLCCAAPSCAALIGHTQLWPRCPHQHQNHNHQLAASGSQAIRQPELSGRSITKLPSSAPHLDVPEAAVLPACVRRLPLVHQPPAAVQQFHLGLHCSQVLVHRRGDVEDVQPAAHLVGLEGIGQAGVGGECGPLVQILHT
jgi:hypothetical protein